MTRISLAVVAVLVLATVSALAWGWPPRVEVSPAVAGPSAADEATTDGVTLAAAAGAAPAAPAVERTVANPDGPGAVAFGSLRILARWPRAKPASDVMVYLRRYERGIPSDLAHGLTDTAGAVTFSHVVVGKAMVTTDRGDRKEIEVVPGPQDVVFDLGDGIDVRGTVTDPDGAAIAGAAVWLQTSSAAWTAGRELTRTGADGTFALAHVNPRLSLGAYADGFAPSRLTDLDTVDCSKPPAVVNLQVQPGGGRLIGTVTDSVARPVVGAVVAAGKPPTNLEHRGDRVTEQWTTRTARTDADGRFALVGLTVGALPLAIRAEGFGLWRSEVEITAGQTTTVEIRLRAVAVLRGRATDGDGAPAAHALISAFDRAPGTPFIATGQIDFDETFGHVAAHADADGEYRIDGVTPGTAHVFAQRGGKAQEGVSVVYTTTVLEVEPGATTEWNPVLAEGHVVEGIVRYADGHPTPGVFVTLTDERSGRTHTQTNGRDGVFRFLCLEASTHSVRVQFWDAPGGIRFMEQGGIVPDRGRLELRAAHDKPVSKKEGTVVGRVDDVAGRITNPKAASVTLHSDAGWFRPDGQLVDGAFRFDNVKPGRFRLALMQGTNVVAQSGWFELLPAATLDTGALRTEPGGAARILVARGAGAEECEPKLYLRKGDFANSTVVELGRRTEVLADDLTPGDYDIKGYAKGMVALRGTMTVRAGQTTEVRLAMQAGALCRFEVWFPEGPVPERRSYRIRAVDGSVFHESEAAVAGAPTRPYSAAANVPVGTWTIEFTSGGWSGSAKFEVVDPSEDVAGRIDLR